MKSIWLPLGLIVVLIGLAVWLGGVRIFVIQPIGAIPKGVTAVVIGIHGLNFVDSPDAVCARLGQPNLFCRGAAAARVANEGKIILRLPYSETLYRMTGPKMY
ncbi:hypothetical protein GGQ73_000682 [Rhizobium skierniewicense]|uniref:Uncharacterized protein n=1 Tax=Rhizobium skierniewicense TaxID=984260 RepID=A0A7W6C2V7_9HYPH|nr:hypothetical protein [Rhizobium skierniewicense]